MSRFYSHANTAKAIVNLYKGEMPFSAFLKNFFAKEKKYGLGDRRSISALCYNYFRIGFAIKNKSIDERLLTSVFICNNESHELLKNEKPEWNEKIHLSLSEKFAVTGIDAETIFRFNNYLSEEMAIKAFNTSFLIQPDLFVRLRPGKQTLVKKKLEEAKIAFTKINETCFAFANGTKLEQVLDINREVVIQDLNSQRVGELLQIAALEKTATAWDCCAASGGKSIMAYDLLPQIKLTVSDVRQSIMQNLHKRFGDAGIKHYQSFIGDLNSHKNLLETLQDKRFDLIICDAPCSGSGTWSRTPEQLLFFHENEITKYTSLQRSICASTIPFLHKGGYFLYITCSVFKGENEDIAEFITQHFPVTLVKMELLKGYEIKADTMFAALFQLRK